MDLTRLLRPRSIAVVGATDRPGSYAAQALLNLAAWEYRGDVWGVNPGRREVLGRPCVPALADLPGAPDAVVVAIPAPGVPGVVDDAGAIGCGGAVVFSAGFGEVAEGVALEAQLAAAALRHDLPVCGPNGNGIVAMHAGAAMWGDAVTRREPGAVALVSQSGNLAINALATRRGLRLHTVVSGGNQTVLSAADYLRALAAEEGVRSIALYLEDDGGPGLCDALAGCTEAGVRVAVFKVGSSAAGARTVAAHSGSLAGDQRVFRALLQEAGAVWAEDLHELLEVAKALAAVPRARMHAARATPGLAILTCSGGDSAQGADEAARQGLGLPELSPPTREALRALLPSAATVANPLDYTAILWGDAPALAGLVNTVAADPAIGQVLVFYDQPDDLDGDAEQSWAAVREGLIAGAARAEVPVIVSSTLPELLDDAAAWRFATHGIAPVAGLRAGITCARALGAAPGEPERLREIAAVARALAEGGAGDQAEASAGWLSEHESKERLAAAGIAVPRGRLVTDAEDAVAALEQLGAPVVLKLSSAGVQHKSELGGVVLDLRTGSDVARAHRHLSGLAGAHGGAVRAERMAEPGAELLVAARADTIVPVLVIGLGGIWTELLDDVVIVALPASAERIESRLRSLRGAGILTGGRGRPPLDVAAAARLIERCGELLLAGGIDLIELNPVLVGEVGAVAVDASILVGGRRGRDVDADAGVSPGAATSADGVASGPPAGAQIR